MKANKLKIHVESRYIYHDSNDTNESIYGFFENQEDETKRWIDFEFVLSDDYDDCFMKYLVNVKMKMTKNMICSPIGTQNSYFMTLMIT